MPLRGTTAASHRPTSTVRSLRRSWIPALLMAFPLALALGLIQAAVAAEVPPIPGAGDRARFLETHTPWGIEIDRAWEAGPFQDEGADEGTEAPEGPRAVHDEYEVLHYDIELDLDIPARILTGTVTIEAEAAVANLTQVALDFYTPMIVDAVRVNGNPALYSHGGAVLTVTLGGTYQAGDPFMIACDYHGTPSYSGAPFRWNTTPAGLPMVLSYSEPYGSPAWWVCKDDPKDKATFSIRVTAPDSLFTVSNGALESFTVNGDGTATCSWVHDYPMSPYLFSIATTVYEGWTETYTALDGITTMPVEYYAYPEDFADAQVSWSRNVEMMEYYASIFGEYPFLEEKYAIAEFQHGGAMEHQTATSMGWGWITGTHSNDFVVAHELAHSWVGDMITMRTWSHAWTKEGFATYCEALWFEEQYGEDYYHDYMESWNIYNYGQFQLYNISPPLHGAIYYKGAWVLHMLRHVIGDEAFFAGIRLYVDDPDLRYGSSDTEDLRAAFEAAAGLDLEWFFDEWVYHPGYPQITTGWSAVYNNGGYDLRLSIAQLQESWPIFKMPLDIAVQTDTGEERFVVWDSLEVQEFDLRLEGRPVGVQVDPDRWVLLQEVEDTGLEADLPGEGPDDPYHPGLAASGKRARLRILPNPSRGAASIRLEATGGAPARPVVVEVFDPAGRRVRTLRAPGATEAPVNIHWDGRDDDGTPLPAGVYLVRADRAGHAARAVLIR